MRYPLTADLPFNRAAVQSGFVAILPGSPQSAGLDGDGFWLILQGNSMLVTEQLQMPFGPMPEFLSERCEPSTIGLWQGKPLWIAAISRSIEIPPSFSAEPFNASGDRLDDATLTLGGMAMQIIHWQKKSRFCSSCGGALTPMPGNFGMLCPVCNYEHFPSIHPCAIVLVRRGDQFLLARKKEWFPGRYGLVAGFLDMGESLEECAAREVLEETGIVIKNVQYVGSQCWPFPSQLMAGFIADYESGEIVVDESELEDARWFNRDEPLIGLPPHRSIARWILDRYMLGSD
ncbi:MAG: NAD(+) diphosphatase [Geobacteraceae bacterium]|nr:NAD(+) diphosphatase [Geobacteraceae bacterium]